MRIGLFDSGLGGLNVLKEMIKKHPVNEYIYYGDNVNIPYGNKSKDELIKLSEKIVEFLISEKVDVIIIACGTCSSTVYEHLKEKYQVPIFDILSPTISYLKDENFNIGVIGTLATINSGYFNQKLSNVKTLATPDLVPLIESDRINSIECEDILKNYLAKLPDIDTLVLGCTHYPLLKDVILKIRNVRLIDMGVILSENIPIKEGNSFKLTIYFSDLNPIIEKHISNYFSSYTLYERKI